MVFRSDISRRLEAEELDMVGRQGVSRRASILFCLLSEMEGLPAPAHTHTHERRWARGKGRYVRRKS